MKAGPVKIATHVGDIAVQHLADEKLLKRVDDRVISS